MYNREEAVLEQYEIEIRNIAKGRGALNCDTDKGMVTLKEFKGSKERAAFLYELLEFLSAQGFLAETILLSKEGGALVSDEMQEMSYLLKTRFPGRECDVKNREDVLSAVRKLAGFHRLAKDFPLETPDILKTGGGSLLSEYERHNRELGKVRNYIRGKNKKNEFEMLFMRAYDGCMAQAKEAAEKLRKQQARLNMAQAGRMCGLCHGDYNQHNVVLFQGEWVLLNFEQIAYDVTVSDLANFIRKILEKYNWNTGFGMEMIWAYDKVRALLPEEWEQLYLRLSYPKKYWKIANHYLGSRKSWISGRDIEKLKKVMDQEPQRMRFLNALYSFTK